MTSQHNKGHYSPSTVGNTPTKDLDRVIEAPPNDKHLYIRDVNQEQFNQIAARFSSFRWEFRGGQLILVVSIVLQKRKKSLKRMKQRICDQVSHFLKER